MTAAEEIRARSCVCLSRAIPVRVMSGSAATTVCVRCGGFVLRPTLPVRVMDNPTRDELDALVASARGGGA